MRALVYTAPRTLQLQEHARPQPAPGECEIAVTWAGVCGSDLAAYLGASRRRKPPMVLGHELVGRTADGRRVVADPLFSCGTCIQCRHGARNLCPNLRLMGMDATPGCFAETVCVPQDHVHDIPERLAGSSAVLAEPLANIVHLFGLASPAGQRVGIVGTGLMGSLALQFAGYAGAGEIAVEDVCPERLESALKMGAACAAHAASDSGRAEMRRFAGPGLDLVIDACGTAQARQDAFDLCRPGGQVVLLGMANGRSELDFAASIYKEHRVAMSFGYTPPDFAQALGLLAAGAVDLTPWTVELPLEEAQRGFERMAGPRGATLKMLLRIGQAAA